MEAFAGAVPGPVEPPRPEKDPDAIKLFVGQVPKSFEEKDLRPYLEPYGAIHELLILRDKISHAHKGRGTSRQPAKYLSTLVFVLCTCYHHVLNLTVCVFCVGCAFVTYCTKQSAELAQRELHDHLVLPGVSQSMKYLAMCIPVPLWLRICVLVQYILNTLHITVYVCIDDTTPPSQASWD